MHRPGITEGVLRHARHDGEDPYDWVIEGLPSEGRVVDLAGGNGALTVRLPPAVAATLPAVGPLAFGDVWRYGRLLFALRHTHVSYPEQSASHRSGEHLHRCRPGTDR